MMSKKVEYRDLILNNTIPIHQYNKQGIGPFVWLTELVETNKNKVKLDTIDFIIIKVLTSKKLLYNLKNKDQFDVYVVGTFRKPFSPSYKIAQLFADFYLEMNILPNIIAVPKHILMKNSVEYANKIRNGILIYERG